MATCGSILEKVIADLDFAIARLKMLGDVNGMHELEEIAEDLERAYRKLKLIAIKNEKKLSDAEDGDRTMLDACKP